MSRLEASVWIDVSPAAAWSYVQDCRRRGEWDSRIEDVENLTGLPMSVGSRIRTTFRGMCSTRFWMEGTYLTFRPGRLSTIRFGRVSRFCPFVEAGGAWSFDPEGNGTRFRTRFRYRLQGGWPGRLLDVLFIRRQVRRETERALRRLKERLEGAVPGTKLIAHCVTN